MPERLGGGRWRAAGRRQAEAPRVPALPPGREAPLSSPPGAHWVGAEGPARPGGEEARGGPRRGGDCEAPPPPAVSPGGCGRCPGWGEGSERRGGTASASAASSAGRSGRRGERGRHRAGLEAAAERDRRGCGAPGRGRSEEGPGGAGRVRSAPGEDVRGGFGPAVGWGWHPCAAGVCTVQPLLLCTEPEPLLCCFTASSSVDPAAPHAPVPAPIVPASLLPSCPCPRAPWCPGVSLCREQLEMFVRENPSP